MKSWISAGLLVLSATPCAAEDWASLGGEPGGMEVDLASVRDEAGFGRSAVVRFSGAREQGVITVHFHYLAHCNYEMLEVIGGQVSSSWSSRVEAMPKLPESERFSRVPLPNQQLNNLYDYLCR